MRNIRKSNLGVELQSSKLRHSGAVTIAAWLAGYKRLLALRSTTDFAAIPTRVIAGVTPRRECPLCWSGDDTAVDYSREPPRR